MRQVLLNSRGSLVARMPRPSLEPTSVLIQVHYSLISVGTELASLRPSTSASAGPEETKLALAKRYLGKAAHDPKHAARKAASLARSFVRQKISTLRPPRVAVPVAAPTAIEWTTGSAVDFSFNEGRLQLTADASPGNYQAISNSFSITPGQVVIVELEGAVDHGPIAIGLMRDDGSAWIGVRTFEVGRLEERFIFNAEDATGGKLVIANVEGSAGSRVTLDVTKVSVRPSIENGLPHSEMDDQGWNVGYSAAGEVIEVGAEVDDLRPGDLVACAGAGQANHADYVVVRRRLVCKLPKDCDLQAAATTTVGTIALQGVRRASPALGERVGVLGLGLIGQIATQLLHANGCLTIGMDLDEARVQRALKLGLDAGESDVEAFKRLVRDMTSGLGLDQVLITAATKSNAVINLAMEVARAKGRVVIVGDVGLNVDRAAFYRKEIDLLMSTSYGPGRYDRRYEDDGIDYPPSHVRWTIQRNMQSYLELIAKKRLDIGSLIDKVASIDEAPRVYAELARGGATAPLGVLLSYPASSLSTPDAPDATRIMLRGARPIPKDRIRYALVGAGSFGTGMLVPKLQNLKNRFFFSGIVSRSATQSSNFARSMQVPILATDLQTVLDDSNIDLLVIATRHHEHADQVIRGLQAGKHVFVEKPLAIHWDDLDRVVDCYESLEQTPVLMVGFNRRFAPAVQELKRTLEGRRSPLVMTYRVHAGYLPPDHWVQQAHGGGRNLGEACHMYDVLRYLAGSEVTSIQAAAIDPGTLPYFRNDNFCATLTYRDGSVANVIYTALGPKQGLGKERLEVFADGEAYLLDDYRSLSRASTGKTLWQADEADKGHQEEMRALGEAIATGGDSPIPFEQLIETTAVALHIEDLLKKGTHRDDAEVDPC